MHDPWLIVGLGNPGRQYGKTRHNLGFMVINRLADELNTTWSKGQGKSKVAVGKIEGKSVILVKPQTFMNLSGIAVTQLLKYYKIDTNELLVVCDDANLPFGRIRLRGYGSDGGHNGLLSIITNLGMQDFARLRIGIGSDYKYGDMVDYVLNKFNKDEFGELDSIIVSAVDAIILLMNEGMEVAMNKYNRADYD